MSAETDLHPIAKVFLTEDWDERSIQLGALLEVKNLAQDAFDCLFSDTTEHRLSLASERLDEMESALRKLHLKYELH